MPDGTKDRLPVSQFTSAEWCAVRLIKLKFMICFRWKLVAPSQPPGRCFPRFDSSFIFAPIFVHLKATHVKSATEKIFTNQLWESILVLNFLFISFDDQTYGDDVEWYKHQGYKAKMMKEWRALCCRYWISLKQTKFLRRPHKYLGFNSQGCSGLRTSRSRKKKIKNDIMTTSTINGIRSKMSDKWKLRMLLKGWKFV